MQAPQQELLKKVFFDWDGTLAISMTTEVLPGAIELVQLVHMAQIEIYVLTARPGADPRDAIHKVLQAGGVNISKENVLWVGTDQYVSHKQAGEDKTKAMIRVTEQDKIKRSEAALMDDRSEYLREAEASGFRTLQVPGDVDLSPQHSIKFYQTAKTHFLAVFAKMYFDAACEKFPNFQSFYSKFESYNGQQANDVYLSYKQIESHLRNAHTFYNQSKDTLGSIRCQLQLAKLYHFYHTVNLKLPADARRDINYSVRRITEAAVNIYKAISNMTVDSHDPALNKECIEFFKSVIVQLRSYKPMENPPELSDLLRQENKTKEQLITQFDAATKLENLQLPKTTEREACLVM